MGVVSHFTVRNSILGWPSGGGEEAAGALPALAGHLENGRGHLPLDLRSAPEYPTCSGLLRQLRHGRSRAPSHSSMGALMPRRGEDSEVNGASATARMV